MKFAPFTRLVSYEFRRFKGLSALALVFILLIPLLYGGIYLAANWNLYNHTDKLKVAVVNLDTGADYKGDHIDGGAMFEDALRERPSFDWQFMNTDIHKAREGLDDGTYYMTVTVPKDFSHKLVSAGTLNPERATIQLERNDANGFIAGILTSQAENALSVTLDASVSDTYFNALLTDLDDIRNGMSEAGEGSRTLHDNLAKVREGTDQLNTSVKAIDLSDLDKQLGAIPGTMARFTDAMSGFESAAGDIENGAVRIGESGLIVKNSATTIATQLNEASTYLTTDLPAEGTKIASAGQSLNAVAGAGADSPLGKTTIGIATAQAQAAALAQKNPELANDPNYQALLAALDSAKTNNDTVADGVASAGASLQNVDLTTSATKLKGNLEAIAEADRQLGTAGTGIVDGLGSIQQGGKKSKEISDSVSQNLNGVKATTDTLTKQGNDLKAGVDKLSSAVETLDTAMPQLVGGAEQLAEGLEKGVTEIPELTETERSSMSDVMSSPVDVTQKVDNPATYYGRGLAPMFFSLGLWIATVSTFLVVRTISGRALTGRGRISRIMAFGFGPVAAIGVIGSLIMGVGLWPILGINPAHPWLYVLLLVVTALSFMALAYMVRMWLGAIQTAIFLVALILQLTACGGTFPLTMLSPFWQALGVISPMRYSVDAFRVAISGGNLAIYWQSLGVLALIGVASMAIVYVLVHRRQIFRMRDLHPPLVTGSSTGDNAFMLRPR